MSEIDYSVEYRHVNCEEYFWENSDEQLYPAVVFLSNTRDDQRNDENVNTLSNMYRSLGCACVKLEYTQVGYVLALPAFQSTCEPAQELAQQLSKIIADNDLDKYPIILHIIGGEGAFIYTEIAPLLEKFISGVVIESLPSSKENTLYSHTLLYQNELLNNGTPDILRFLPFRSTIWRFLILARAWYWVLVHAFYVPFTGRDLSTRLKKLDPKWRELFICEPSNVVSARKVCISRRPSLIQKKLLKFPALSRRRNNLYQQCPKQYESKIGTFLKNVCDDFATTHAVISVSEDPH